MHIYGARLVIRNPGFASCVVWTYLYITTGAWFIGLVVPTLIYQRIGGTFSLASDFPPCREQLCEINSSHMVFMIFMVCIVYLV